MITPTRELAMQIADSVAAYGRHVPLRSAVVYGGVPIEPQIRELRAGVEILVATPGRLMDHVGQRTVNLSQVEILVLDEADRMLDMGFIPDIRKIVGPAPGATPEPPLQRHVLGRDPAPLPGVPARSGDRRGRRPEHRRRGRRAGPLPGRPRPQGGPPHPPHPARPDGAGPRVHPDEAGGEPAGLVPRPARRQRGRDPLGSQPARADPGPRGLQARRGDLPRGDRRRVARARHRGAPVRRQLRAPVRGARLPPSDRADRAGRLDRAWRSRSSASTRSTCCGPSSACSRRRSRTGSSRASSPTGPSRRGRSAGSGEMGRRVSTGAATTPTTSRSGRGRPAAGRASRAPGQSTRRAVASEPGLAAGLQGQGHELRRERPEVGPVLVRQDRDRQAGAGR